PRRYDRCSLADDDARNQRHCTRQALDADTDDKRTFFAAVSKVTRLAAGTDMRVSSRIRQLLRNRVVAMALRGGATFTIVLGVTLATAASATADLTASYDGTLLLPKTAENAIVAGGLMQAGSALTGTIAVNAETEGVTGLYYVTGTLKKTRFKLTGSSDK